MTHKKHTEIDHTRCAVCVKVEGETSTKGIDQIHSARVMRSVEWHIALAVEFEHFAEIRVSGLEVVIDFGQRTTPIATLKKKHC